MTEKQAADILEQGAMSIVGQLTEHGFEAYLVGGCVRDKQLSRPIKDYDIATSARPEQVQKLFARTIPTGLQHGTVTVMIGKEPYEVTTFRKESEYESYRRPTEVEYIDNLLEDLERRDFTMNAMAINRNGELVDPFGGLQDMQQGILRCVGNPLERFGEDALRIFRCLRFAAEYRLAIEPATWQGLLQQIDLLQHIAMERVRAELERMLEGRHPEEALRLLIASRALSRVKEELLIAGIHRLEQAPVLSSLTAPEPRYACLYIRLGVAADQVKDDMRKLTFANQRMESVARIVGAHAFLRAELAQGTGEADAWKLAVLRAGLQAAEALAAVYAADEHCLSDYAPINRESLQERWRTEATRWMEEMPVKEMKELAVTGKELMAELQMKAGPWVGTVLSQLLQLTALRQLPNERTALLQEAKARFSQWQETTST